MTFNKAGYLLDKNTTATLTNGTSSNILSKFVNLNADLGKDKQIRKLNYVRWMWLQFGYSSLSTYAIQPPFKGTLNLWSYIYISRNLNKIIKAKESE